MLRRAQEAAAVVGDTLYARYYGIDYGQIWALGTGPETALRPRRTPRGTVPDFDALVRSRAGLGLVRWGRDVAANGKVIEQAQILTTHNLAVLVNAGITLDWGAQARDAWKATRHHLAKATGERHLHHRKNAAYAWRQTVFYLALCPLDRVGTFLDDPTLAQGLAPEATAQAQAILQGLKETIASGAPANGPFLGWVARSDRRHTDDGSDGSTGEQSPG